MTSPFQWCSCLNRFCGCGVSLCRIVATRSSHILKPIIVYFASVLRFRVMLGFIGCWGGRLGLLKIIYFLQILQCKGDGCFSNIITTEDSFPCCSKVVSSSQAPSTDFSSSFAPLLSFPVAKLLLIYPGTTLKVSCIALSSPLSSMFLIATA